jgi:uncharacterized HAD superfamily protein
MLNEKVILTDVDGVLLDWVHSFTQWMERHGYEQIDNGAAEYDIGLRYDISNVEKERLVRMFNESAWIRKLPPLRDAIKYVRKLHEEHGYIFRVISSLSTDPYAGHLRTKNLIEMFGPTVFESYTYVDTGADKDEVLAPYEGTGCFWIEDKPENAVLGQSLGLESILVDHPFNKDAFVGDMPRCKNWKEIYEVIVGS